jgi:Carboxypeptidase regulatory-like domain/Protein of unknown function (DUF3761)
MKRLCAIALLVATSACGSNSTPAPAPTPVPTNTAAIVITNLSATVEGTAGTLTYHLAFRLAETSGKVGVSVTSLTIALANGGTGTATGPAVRVAAGATSDPSAINLTDSSGRSATSSLTLTVNFTDDGSHAGNASASAAVVPLTPTPAPTPATFAVTGTVTDGTSGGVLPGISIQIVDGINAGTSTKTDTGGSYSLSNIATGSFMLSASNPGYVTSTKSVSLTGNARVDFVLARVGAPTPTPSPTPTPGPNGATCPASQVPADITAVCNDNTFSSSQNRSGTCSSHGGVKCWICPGPLCSN